MGRKVKCYTCNGTGDKETEMVNLSPNSQPKYYHKGECEQKELASREERRVEQEQKDNLNAVLKRIHKLDLIPSMFWMEKITPLRNGEELLMAQRAKRFKEGFTYQEITDAYEYCAKDIVKYIDKRNKSKNPFDSTLGELRYGFTIMVNKIQLVKKRKAQAEQRKKLEEARQNSQEETMSLDTSEEKEYKYQKRKEKNHVDISKLLG